ncbi:TetR family transcriptional regulator [Neorhizobium sp. P12A]|uniref:TetR/AcrR family transcriptional regulator n=1 Tax=Neorhizobium sp. P12A TaxID=2268027 RepID=UPI0011EF6607|nr:TetR/AcrR family transcriptional regulator [Neorhizobium sp. P12A]KAA0689141.1 TetR family transcriptional regulator [Neorhizobium sp. P12A]
MPRPSVRGKLVAAGLETFHAKGFNGSSIQDITEAAGVPKGSFFNHFKSKEALALEVLEPYGQSSRIDMLFDKTKTPLDRLKTHFEFLADGYAAWEFERGCLLGNFGTEMSADYPLMRQALDRIYGLWSSSVAAVLREAQAEGTVSTALDADELGRFLVTAWEGVAMQLKVTRTRKPVDEFFKIAFRVLLK